MMKTRPHTRQDGQKTSAKPKVFISYAREDSRFVEKLTRDLVRDGFDVRRDLERLRGGDSFPAKIADAIKDSDFFLLVVSRSSNKSDWVRDELEKAVTWRNDSGRPITIPIRLGNSPSLRPWWEGSVSSSGYRAMTGGMQSCVVSFSKCLCRRLAFR